MKYSRKTQTITLAILFAALQTVAQPGALQVGDTLPESSWNELNQWINNEKNSDSIRPRLLLLELWTSGCGGCLESMVNLANYQKKEKGNLSVALLTLDDSAHMKNFLIRRKDLAALNVPWKPVTASWKALFPNESYPHIIWLGSDRQVKAITEATYLTEKHIAFVLKNNFINLPVKKDLLGFNTREPLFLAKAGQRVLYSSSFTGPIEGIGGSGGALNKLDSTSKRLHLINASVYGLYAAAFRNKLLIDVSDYPYRIRLHLKDSSLFKRNEYGQLPLFCYELILPNQLTADPGAAYAFMQKDLDRFFNFTSSIKKMQTMAYLVVATDTGNAASQEKVRTESTIKELQMIQTPAEAVATFIRNTMQLSLPVLYHGPVTKKVTGTLKNNYNSIEALRKDLHLLGLDLVLRSLKLDMLVLSDK